MAKKIKKRALPAQTLENQLLETLSWRAGERGHDEGALETLHRIIHERDKALEILALDRLKNHRNGNPF